MVGDEECVVTASSANSISCTVGITAAGYYNVSVLVAGKGFAIHPNGKTNMSEKSQSLSFFERQVLLTLAK